jgi:hypothetical protein
VVIAGVILICCCGPFCYECCCGCLSKSKNENPKYAKKLLENQFSNFERRDLIQMEPRLTYSDNMSDFNSSESQIQLSSRFDESSRPQTALSSFKSSSMLTNSLFEEMRCSQILNAVD